MVSYTQQQQAASPCVKVFHTQSQITAVYPEQPVCAGYTANTHASNQSLGDKVETFKDQDRFGGWGLMGVGVCIIITNRWQHVLTIPLLPQF